MAQLFDGDRLGAVVPDIYAAPTGRPSYPPLRLVKVLLLQQWYAASAPELAAALCDRLSFRRFVGLGLADEAPHYATISRFRQQVFGTLKRLYRYRRARYLGLARNTTELWCKCLAYNLRRAERLLPRPAPGVVVP